jgi:hypothetical protein
MTAIRQRNPETPVKEWVTEVTVTNDLGTKSRIVTFLLWAYGGLLATTMGIFFLQGFSHVTGFSLDLGTLHWLGGATIGEIAGLLGITVTHYFGTKK